MKRKVDHQVPAVKKQKRPTVKRKSTKKSKKLPKPKARKPRKGAVYKPRESFTGGFQEEEQINFEEFNSDGKIRHCTQDELNELARQAYRAEHSKGGFGPRFAR